MENVWLILRKASIAVTICIILSAFGAAVGFLVIIGDLASPLFVEWVHNVPILQNRTFITFIISFPICVPLGSLSKLSYLRFSSSFAILSMAFLVFVILFRGSQLIHSQGILWDQVYTDIHSVLIK